MIRGRPTVRRASDANHWKAPTRFKGRARQASDNKSSATPTAKNVISLRKTADWTTQSSLAECLKIAPSESGIFAHSGDVLGRRRVTTAIFTNGDSQ